MCAPLPIIAGATMAAGQLFQGYSAMQQGNYESSMARRNAALEVEAARGSIDRGRDEARNFYRDAGRVKGQQRAAMAANGIDLGFGTAVHVQEDTTLLAREDAQALYDNINERVRGQLINAQNFESEGRAARHRGRTAMVGSVFSAAGSVAGGFQQQAAIDAANDPSQGSLMGGFRQQRAMRDKLGI